MKTPRNPQLVPLWISLTPSLLAGAVAVLAPVDVVDRLPALRVPVDVMTRLVPAMPGYLALSHFPQVTAATFLLAWVLLPFQLVFCLIWSYRMWDPDRLIRWSQQRGWGRMAMIGVSLGCVVPPAAGLLFLPKDAWFTGSFGVANNRHALALVGAGGFWWLCMALSLLLFILLKTSSRDYWT